MKTVQKSIACLALFAGLIVSAFAGGFSYSATTSNPYINVTATVPTSAFAQQIGQSFGGIVICQGPFGYYQLSPSSGQLYKTGTIGAGNYNILLQLVPNGGPGGVASGYSVVTASW